MLSRFRRGAAVPGALIVLLGCATAPLFGQTEAESLSASFRKASRRVLPAVVSVRSSGGSPVGRFPFRRGFPPGGLPNPLAQDFVGVESEGSGIVIDAEKGHVLTNAHVVQDAAGTVVVLPDGGERAVAQVRRDPKSDLALLVLENPKGLTQIEWGDSDALETGDWVLAIGHPFGRSASVSAGIISGKGRGAGVSLYEDLLQTDAVINPGNSGGPLINLKGQVVGIITAIPTRRGGFEGAGFAVPASRARRIATDLVEAGKVRRAYLGVQIGPVDPRAAERLKQPGAVAITGVAPDGPAATAGLRAGDIFVSLQGKPVGGQGALQSAIEAAKVGEPLPLVIDRDGERLEMKVTPKEQPETFDAPGRLLRGPPRGSPRRESGEPGGEKVQPEAPK